MLGFLVLSFLKSNHFNQQYFHEVLVSPIKKPSVTNFPKEYLIHKYSKNQFLSKSFLASLYVLFVLINLLIFHLFHPEGDL